MTSSDKTLATMTKREAEELIEIEIDGTEKAECTEERLVFSEFTTFYIVNIPK